MLYFDHLELFDLMDMICALILRISYLYTCVKILQQKTIVERMARFFSLVFSRLASASLGKLA